MTDQTHRADSGELRQIVERLERIAAEKQEAADLFKDVMAQAKSAGYDTAILRKILAERKRDSDDLAEERALLDMYREALGYAPVSAGSWDDIVGDAKPVYRGLSSHA